MLVANQITIRTCQRFVLSECLEYDDRLWIFNEEGACKMMTFCAYLMAKAYHHLNEYRIFINLFITSTKEICTVCVLLGCKWKHLYNVMLIARSTQRVQASGKAGS